MTLFLLYPLFSPTDAHKIDGVSEGVDSSLPKMERCKLAYISARLTLFTLLKQ